MWSETPTAREAAQGNRENGGGCAFVLDGAAGDPGHGPGCVSSCNAPRQPGSPYCPRHHAFCHLPNGSAAERQMLREIEALAKAVGGTQGRAARYPTARLLRRLDRLARAVPPAKIPLIVLIVLEDPGGDTTDP
jgi:hypothetical protein